MENNAPKKEWAVDVAVLCIFFNRPACFEKVFAEVKKARPRKLFLYQDGAREGNEKDIVNVKKCRDIALDIDWDCELYTMFQEKNYGCDPSGYIAQAWAFENVDKCIVLEDDCVPTQSFFPFCKELLDKYENDQRINMICGMNNLETVDTPYSYIFSETGSIWGWASWSRVAKEWEPDYDFLSDEYSVKKLYDYMEAVGAYPKNKFKTWYSERDDGVPHHETVKGTNQFANHRLNIVPKYNMITNVGNTPEGGTHSMASLDMIPKGLRRIYTMKAYEIEFPLKHPKYVIEDMKFKKDLFRIMGTGHPWVQRARKIEKAFLILKHDGLNALMNKIKNR